MWAAAERSLRSSERRSSGVEELSLCDFTSPTDLKSAPRTAWDHSDRSGEKRRKARRRKARRLLDASSSTPPRRCGRDDLGTSLDDSQQQIYRDQLSIHRVALRNKVVGPETTGSAWGRIRARITSRKNYPRVSTRRRPTEISAGYRTGIDAGGRTY